MGFAMRTREQEGCGPTAAIGIDLGTAFSRVGIWKDGDVLIVPNDHGKLATPSVVAFTEQCVLVGEVALEQADWNLENTIFAPQRLMGAKYDSPIVQWFRSSWPGSVVRGQHDGPLLRVHDRGRERHLRPEEIVTMLIEHLRKAAERYLGVAATEAVVTVPAQFGQLQCQYLLKACTAARLRVHSLIKAPTAAAIAFCLTNPVKGKIDMLVCDIGASYFDFALLSVTEDGCLRERAIGSDFIDLDACLMKFCQQDLLDRFGKSLAGQHAALRKLHRGCEVAKRKLSQWTQARIDVVGILENDNDYSVNVSRGHFEDACRADVEALMNTIDWCLEDCGLERPDVDVVLVGGCARVPRMRRAAREFFHGRPPREVLRPDHAAVLGASVYAAALTSPTKGCIGKSAGSSMSGSGEFGGLHRFEVLEVHPWATLEQEDGAPQCLAAPPPAAPTPAAGAGSSAPSRGAAPLVSSGGGDDPELPPSGPSSPDLRPCQSPFESDWDCEAAPRNEGVGRPMPLGEAARGPCRASGRVYACQAKVPNTRLL